jgi:S-adenosylmethionine:tRNA ribosyltransferase-isomerase
MKLSDFNYELPEKLMAQEPIHPKHCSRMMVADSSVGKISNYHFYDLPSFLREKDIIVINDTRVVPAVIRGKRENGGQIEIKMVSKKSPTCWDCLIESLRPVFIGEHLKFGKNDEMVGIVKERNWCDTGWLIEFDSKDGKIEEQMKKFGQLFLPLHLPQNLEDPEDYQTVYSFKEGSLQPPTAGLHFTNEIIHQIKSLGIPIVSITQHVGRIDHPLPSDDIAKHQMYEEYYEVPEKTAEAINQTKQNAGRVIAIGTTVTRTLETIATNEGFVSPGSGWTKLYIYPGFKFRVINALLSNFQSPGITTLILACAFAGTEFVMNAYNEAVRRNYKFLEFGDCIFYV